MPVPALRKLTGIIEAWFRIHQRGLPWRETYDPYLVWVSEVMLQQTRMEVVLRYYTTFIRRFPDVAALAQAQDDEVLAAWSGLGYYRRARMLRDGARDVVERFRGVLPRTVDELRTIRGIGRYTAGAIASIAFNEHAPIVDGNVARIVARLNGLTEPVASPSLMRKAWTHAESLASACSIPREFNQGLMEIGALICKPQRPLCSECPLSSHCVALASGAPETFPGPREKRATVAMEVPLYLIFDRAGRVLMRRESGDLMTSMYHLPHGDTSLLAGEPVAASRRQLVGTFRHTITTRRIEFQLFKADLTDAIRESSDAYLWIEPHRVEDLPHPSYVAKALRLAGRLQSTQCVGG